MNIDRNNIKYIIERYTNEFCIRKIVKVISMTKNTKFKNYGKGSRSIILCF